MVLCRCDSAAGLVQMFSNDRGMTHREAKVTFLGSLPKPTALIFLPLCFTGDKVVRPRDRCLPVASSLGLPSSL